MIGRLKAAAKWLLEERVFLGGVVFVFMMSALESFALALKGGNWLVVAMTPVAMFGVAHSYWTKWRHQVKA